MSTFQSQNAPYGTHSGILWMLKTVSQSTRIEQEDCVKLLGVNIDKKLDFKFHISEVCRKAGRQLNALRRQS